MSSLGSDLQFKPCLPQTQMPIALPGEAWSDNHPLENRPLILIESLLMTHTNTNCIVMLGAVSVLANLFVIVWAAMCGGDSYPEKRNVSSSCCEKEVFPLNYSIFTD